MECQALTMVNAPNVRDFNADLTTLDTLIKAVNPQKLTTFKVSKDIRDKSMSIAQDIKDADRELNESECVQSALKLTQASYENLLRTWWNERSDQKIYKDVMTEIAKYIAPEDGRGKLRMSQLPVEVRNSVSQADEYKKQNIATKTREIARKRGIQL
jgi:hypothetical protein